MEIRPQRLQLKSKGSHPTSGTGAGAGAGAAPAKKKKPFLPSKRNPGTAASAGAAQQERPATEGQGQAQLTPEELAEQAELEALRNAPPEKPKPAGSAGAHV